MGILVYNGKELNFFYSFNEFRRGFWILDESIVR